MLQICSDAFFVGFVLVDIFAVILSDRCYVLHKAIISQFEVTVVMPSVGYNLKYKGRVI
jgi:hypothetical protein